MPFPPPPLFFKYFFVPFFWGGGVFFLPFFMFCVCISPPPPPPPPPVPRCECPARRAGGNGNCVVVMWLAASPLRDGGERSRAGEPLGPCRPCWPVQPLQTGARSECLCPHWPQTASLVCPFTVVEHHQRFGGWLPPAITESLARASQAASAGKTFCFC